MVFLIFAHSSSLLSRLSLIDLRQPARENLNVVLMSSRSMYVRAVKVWMMRGMEVEARISIPLSSR